MRVGLERFIFIDGFLADFNKLIRRSNFEESMAGDDIKSLPDYPKLFTNIVEPYRRDFCNKEEIAQKRGEQFCFHLCYTYEGIKDILNYHKYTRKTWLDLSKYIATLTEEQENDIRKKRANYLQNIIIITESVCPYSITKLCCANLMQKVDLKFKTKKEYANYNAFISAWIDVLKNLFGSFHVSIRGTSLID